MAHGHVETAFRKRAALEGAVDKRFRIQSCRLQSGGRPATALLGQIDAPDPTFAACEESQVTAVAAADVQHSVVRPQIARSNLRRRARHLAPDGPLFAETPIP